jgi:hypothetical protein
MLARRTFSAGSNLPKLSIPRKTFNELKNFGGGLIDKLNAPGQTAGPECVGRFANLDVAKKRILQGSPEESITPSAAFTPDAGDCPGQVTVTRNSYPHDSQPALGGHQPAQAAPASASSG